MSFNRNDPKFRQQNNFPQAAPYNNINPTTNQSRQSAYPNQAGSYQPNHYSQNQTYSSQNQVQPQNEWEQFFSKDTSTQPPPLQQAQQSSVINSNQYFNSNLSKSQNQYQAQTYNQPFRNSSQPINYAPNAGPQHHQQNSNPQLSTRSNQAYNPNQTLSQYPLQSNSAVPYISNDNYYNNNIPNSDYPPPTTYSPVSTQVRNPSAYDPFASDTSPQAVQSSYYSDPHPRGYQNPPSTNYSNQQYPSRPNEIISTNHQPSFNNSSVSNPTPTTGSRFDRTANSFSQRPINSRRDQSSTSSFFNKSNQYDQSHSHHDSKTQYSNQRLFIPTLNKESKWSNVVEDPLLLADGKCANNQSKVIPEKIKNQVLPLSMKIMLAQNDPATQTPTPSKGTVSSKPVSSKKERPKRERSASPSPNHRSRSPSPRGVTRDNKRQAKSPPRTIANNLPNKGNTNPPQSLNKKIDITQITPHDLINKFHIPSISKSYMTLSSFDLSTRFPSLIIPPDFLNVKIEWNSIIDAMNYDYFQMISTSIPFIFENTPSYLKTPRKSADEQSQNKFFSDIMDPPKFSYLSSNTMNNSICEMPMYLDRYVNINKPVKFNAKVIISCGFKDFENDNKIDHNATRKLRMLCGRKKGSAVLLGTSWCKDLDGGNPLLDKSCLLNTARRAIYAQALIDIAKGDPGQNLVKLCEINYHRPREEIKNKIYPEQEEVTVVYLYSLQQNYLENYSTEDFNNDWEIFSKRVGGQHAGPMLGKTVEDFLSDYQQDYQILESNISIISQEQSISSNECKENENIEDSQKIATEPSPTPASTNIIPIQTKFEKPPTPTLLISPMPLPKEIESEPSKRLEGLHLRILPLSAMLSYTSDDASERVFEASLAAEMVQSCIAHSFSNIITDFLIADIPGVSHLADVKVFLAKSKLTSVLKKSNTSGATNTNSNTETSLTDAVLNQDEGDLNKIAETNDKTQDVDQQDNSFDNNSENEMSEEEAKEWRRKFIGACRWFDVTQEHFLRPEILQLILYSSLRNLSRSDITLTIDRVCKGEKFRYESF